MRELLLVYRGNRTQKEMAKLYNVTQQAWSQWEIGCSSPNISIMKKIETDSGYPLEQIFFDLFNK